MRRPPVQLVTGLLEKDPAKRYTLEQALAHPWVRGDAAPSTPLASGLLTSLLAFNARNKFRKMAMELVASTMSAAAVAELCRKRIVRGVELTSTLDLDGGGGGGVRPGAMVLHNGGGASVAVAAAGGGGGGAAGHHQNNVLLGGARNARCPLTSRPLADIADPVEDDRGFV